MSTQTGIFTAKRNVPYVYYNKNKENLTGKYHLAGVSSNDTKTYWSVQYKIETPLRDDNNTKISSLKVQKLSFVIDVNDYYWLAKFLSDPSEGDGNLYGAFTTNPEISYNDLMKLDSFVVVEYNDKGFQATKVEVDLSENIDINITLQANTTYYLFLFTKGDAECYYEWPQKLSSGAKESQILGVDHLDIEYEYNIYSLLDPPNIEAITSEIVKQSGSAVNLKWTGQDTSNEYFNGYLLSWVNDSQTFSIPLDKDSVSYDFVTQNAIRGKDIEFFIEAVHKIDQLYNSEKVRFGTVRVNSLPKISNVFLEEETKISFSKPTKVKLKVEYEDADTGQEILLYWRKNETEEFKLYSEVDGVELQNNQKFELKITDGLEYGSSWQAKIGEGVLNNLTINTPPTLTEFSPDYNFRINKITVSNPEKKHYFLRASYSNQVGPWVDMEDFEGGAISLLNLLGELQGPFEYLQIDGKIRDEYGDESNIASHKLDSPVSASNFNDTFLSQISFDFSKLWKIQLKEGFENINISCEENSILFNNPNELEPNRKYDFKIIVLHKPLSVTENSIPVWVASLQITTKDFVGIAGTPSNNIGGTITPYNVFGSWLAQENRSQTWTINTTKEYTDNMILKISIGSATREIEVEGSKETSFPVWSGTISERKLYDWSMGEFDLQTTTGKYEAEVSIGYYLKEGEETVWIGSNKAKLVYDFDYVAESPKTVFKNLVYEKYVPTIDLTGLQIASQGILCFELQVDRQDGRGFVLYDRMELEVSNLGYPYFDEDKQLFILPKLPNTFISFKPIGEITTFADYSWKIKTSLSSKPEVFKISEWSTPVVQHGKPSNFIITKSIYNEGNDENSKEITLGFTVNLNCDPKVTIIEYKVIANDKERAITSNSEGELTFKIEGEQEKDKPPYRIYIKAQTIYKIDEIQNNTKEANSNEIIVYANGPTISYRSHQIGINTTQPKGDSVLTVSPWSGKTFIHLGDPSSEKVISIDLSNSTISKAVINAGSWDGTDPGYIPIPSTGLALVATSGELSDLNNTSPKVVFFIAGDSTSV